MTRDEMIEKLTKAHTALCDAVKRHCDGGAALRVSIPSRPDDTDFLIGDPILEVLAALRAPAVTGEAEQAYGYLSRLLTHCAPQCQPLPDLMGLCSQIDNLIAGLRAAPPAAGAPPALVALVQEWQAARKPTVLATPGEFLAETFQAAVRRMSAADEALAACRLDVAEAETPAAGKRVQTPNEAEMLRALSDALTGGNASTWEQVLHAAEQHRSESGAPVVPEGATTNAPLVADMLAASLHAQAVKSRGECPTCGGLWPCDRCTTRAVDLDALKRNLDLAAETVETCAICGKSLSTVLRAWDDALLCEACAEPSVPVSAVEGMTVAGARAFWRWKDEAVAHEQLRADVMTIYSDPHLTWEQARVKLAHALAAPPADAGAPPCIGHDPLCPCQDGDSCHYRDTADTRAMQRPDAGAPPALVALESIAMAARRGLAFGHQATPQTPERMIERKEQALGQILDMCERHGITSSVLRGSPAPAPVAPPDPETMTDDELIASVVASGRDPAVVAEETRALLLRVVEQHKAKSDAPPAVAGGDAPECPECDGDGYTEIGPIGDNFAMYQEACRACRATGRRRQEGQ